jgi:hypothetical protein
MKRWILASCPFLISSLVVLVPVAAQATTVSGGQLYNGKPVKTTISTPGQQIKYTFSGQAHKHVTFQVTHFNFSDGNNPGSLYLKFREPGSTGVYKSCYFADNGYCDFTTPLTGTWTVKVVPYSSSVGSMTLTFARDVATMALASGTPVTSTIKFEGQHAGYTFSGTASKHVTFQVTQFNFSDGTNPGSFWLYFYKPGSTSSYTEHFFSDNGYVDFTPPLTGTWTVKLIPYDASIGSMTLTFANDVGTAALASGTPVTSTIKFEGQHAGYTFSTSANATRTFDVSQFNFTDGTNPGSFWLYFYEPGSTSSYTSCYFSDNGSCDVTTPVSGTWSIQLVPYDASIGSLTLTMT